MSSKNFSNIPLDVSTGCHIGEKIPAQLMGRNKQNPPLPTNKKYEALQNSTCVLEFSISTQKRFPEIYKIC